VKRLILVLLLAAGLSVPAASPAAAAKLGATAKLTACATSLEQSGRFLVAEGRMRRVAGAARLQMRFDLQIRTPERSRWTVVDAPQFGKWTTADPAPRRYVYSKRVENLAAPATYRMIVRYRWVSESGRVIARERRRTRPCRQPDLRPDLEPAKVALGPVADDGRRPYLVVVRNTGSSPAAPFKVSIGIGPESRTVDVAGGLAPGAATQLELIAPACEPGGIVVAAVDPTGTVDEADETDNQQPSPCR